MRRFFSKRQKYILGLLSGFRCGGCGAFLGPSFHADHRVPYSKGGLTTLVNGQALCRKCNLKKGNASMTITLRPWQSEALRKAIKWLLEDKEDRHFLINAAPGSGKTIGASAIAQVLFEKKEIDRVVVIAPRSEVVNQWSDDFRLVTGRYMGKVTGSDGQFDEMGVDICATWQAVQGMFDALQVVCRSQRVLLICDEHHHAAVRAAWGESAHGAFEDARFVLILTGTPIRSDGNEAIWLAYDDFGAIDHPEGGTYTLTYGEAVDLGYCRPVTFHRHEGKFTVDLDSGEKIEISGHQPANLSNELKRIPGLQRALDFYKLACTPQYEVDEKTPLSTGYHGSMIEWATTKLDDLRLRMPEAGGLVIAPTIEMAEFMCDLIELMEGEKPTIVHSQLSNADGRIKAFRNTDKRWIVSVAMISEGVDIKRLRVLIYLPYALTELAFRQAVGRVVRTNGPDDDTRAYVIMPSFETFENYARRVEAEMSPQARQISDEPKTKKCPICGQENELAARNCSSCDYEFPVRGGTGFKTCSVCGAMNPRGAEICQNCGASFKAEFHLSLDEALRMGAIVRGMELSEDEVQASERIADDVRKRVLRSGDENLIRLIQVLPEESWERMRQVFVPDEEDPEGL